MIVKNSEFSFDHSHLNCNKHTVTQGKSLTRVKNKNKLQWKDLRKSIVESNMADDLVIDLCRALHQPRRAMRLLAIVVS